jgi:hypothetical protein
MSHAVEYLFAAPSSSPIKGARAEGLRLGVEVLNPSLVSEPQVRFV